MPEEKRRVNAAIDMKLYENVMKLGFSISEAITLGLEKLLEHAREETPPTPIGSIATEVLEAKDSLIQSLEARTNDLNERIVSLEEQLRVKDSQLEKQAVHIQTMIQQRAIEAPGAKKPWWQFW